MADIIQDVILRVSSDAEELRKGVGQVDDKIKETKKNTGGLQNQFKKLLPALGVAAIVAGFKKIATASLQAYDVQAKAEQKLAQVLKSTNMVAGRSLDQLKEQAKRLQSETLFGDEEILKGATTTLLTFTKISGEQFDQAQRAVLDLSTSMGTDLQSASIQVGKALNDPILGVTALARSGIQFTEQQKDVIKQLTQTGRVAEAQTIILKELNTQFGGQAAAAAKVGLGAWTQFKNIVGDLSEEFGSFLLKGLNPIIDGMKSLASAAVDYVSTPVSEQLEKERIELNSLVFQITEANTTQEERVKLIGEIQSQYPNFLKNIDAEKVTNEQLTMALSMANEEYLKKILLQRELEAKEKIQNNLIDATTEKLEREEKLRQKIIKANEDYNLGIDFTNKTLEESADLVRDALYDVPFSNGALSARLLSDNIFALTGRIRGSNAEMNNLNDELDVSTSKYEQLRAELLGLGTDITSKEDGNKAGKSLVDGVVNGVEKERDKLQELDLFDRSVFEVPVEDTEFRFDNVIKLAEDAFKQIEGIPLPDLLEDRFVAEKFQIIGQNMIEAFSMANDAINALPIGEKAQKEIERLEKLIETQKEAVDKAKLYAEEGNSEQLALEEDRLDRLETLKKQEEKQKEQALKRSLAIQKSMALAEIAINLATTLSNIDKTSSALGPLGIPLKVTQTIQAIAQAAINTAAVLSANASFYEGTEDTGRGGKLDSKGGFAAVLHPNERVMTAKQNKRIKQALGNVSNDDLVKMIENSKSLSINPNGLLVDSSAINEKMNTKMDEMISLNREMLKAMKRNGVNVNIDRNGLSVMMHQMVKRQNILNSL